jgi:hypothetical protein
MVSGSIIMGNNHYGEYYDGNPELAREGEKLKVI